MTAIEKFQKFSPVYADRQANRPKVNEQSTELEKAEARRYAKDSSRGLERFFQRLSEKEIQELRDTLDPNDAFTAAIIQQAKELYYL